MSFLIGKLMSYRVVQMKDVGYLRNYRYFSIGGTLGQWFSKCDLKTPEIPDILSGGTWGLFEQ